MLQVAKIYSKLLFLYALYLFGYSHIIKIVKLYLNGEKTVRPT